MVKHMNDPLSYFADRGVVDAAQQVLTAAFKNAVQAFPNDDPESIEAGLKEAFQKITSGRAHLTADALLAEYRASRSQQTE
ncbi:hypothetical protein CEK28_08760 [Xenophilus sp. AP218F]|nr:hypothetical protein CEK28_08760 [Xenophilus sp. AP218F]